MNTYKLTNFIFIRMLKITTWIFAAFAIIQTYLFYNAAKSNDLFYFCFEQVLEKAGIGTVFLICNIIILVVFAITIMSFYWGSKSIYSIVSLPIKTTNKVIALLLPCVLNILILWCIQLALIIVFGKWLPEFLPEHKWFTYMNNYILLGAVRYKYLSVVLPISLLQLIKSLFLLFIAPATIAFVFFTAIAKKYYEFYRIFAFTFLFFIIFGSLGMINDYMTTLFLFILFGYMLTKITIYIKRRCIV